MTQEEKFPEWKEGGTGLWGPLLLLGLSPQREPGEGGWQHPDLWWCLGVCPGTGWGHIQQS